MHMGIACLYVIFGALPLANSVWHLLKHYRSYLPNSLGQYNVSDIKSPAANILNERMDPSRL